MFKVFEVRSPLLPWGDYGDFLANGWSRLDSDGETVLLHRTGPFMPPITFPDRGWLAVTSAFFEKLERSGLSGLTEWHIEKRKITHVDWQQWKPYGDAEPKFPADCQPDSYLAGPHSEDASKELGTIRALTFEPGIDFVRDDGFHLLSNSWNGADLFSVRGDPSVAGLFMTEPAMHWFDEQAGPWLEFSEPSIR